jgi:hypothetical protein
LPTEFSLCPRSEIMKLNPGLIALSIGAFGIGVPEFAPM